MFSFNHLIIACICKVFLSMQNLCNFYRLNIIIRLIPIVERSRAVDSVNLNSMMFLDEGRWERRQEIS